MISYDTACEMAGFTQAYEPPNPAYAYFAYKNGEAQEFCHETDAKAFSKLVDRVTINQHEIDNWKQERRELESKAFDIWYTHLRKEYRGMNNTIFDLCYNKAYADGHAYGHDEVVNKMCEVTYFAIKILETQI